MQQETTPLTILSPNHTRLHLAYEWSNYRYVSARFNSRKGTASILDPFTLAPEWFVLCFNSFLIKPHANLLANQALQVKQTIERLRLNSDDDLVAERAIWVNEYRNKAITFAHLQKRAPFIAYELVRQKLLNR